MHTRGAVASAPLPMPTHDLPYVDPDARRSVAYRAYVRLVGTRAMGSFSKRVVWRIDPLLLRLTRGRLGMGLALPTALLETRGARTGQLRRNGVIYFHDGDRVTIVASRRAARGGRSIPLTQLTPR
jgi:F420H(2)-dependent quinone reductase